MTKTVTVGKRLIPLEHIALGFINTYRNLCIAPSAELRVTFEQIRRGYVTLSNG